MEIKNARIIGTKLGREDHGILTFSIFVETDCYNVGIGNYALDEYDKENDCRKYSAKSIEAISKVLETVGVSNWEDLKGEYIRIVDEGWGKPVSKFGHLMENKWFDLREFFKIENGTYGNY